MNGRLVKLCGERKDAEEELHKLTVMSLHWEHQNKADSELGSVVRQCSTADIDIGEDDCDSLISRNDLNPSCQCNEVGHDSDVSSKE